MATPGRWEHFEHGADVGVRGRADSCEGAFEQAALALVAVVCDPAGVAPRQQVAIRCAAPDEELLLLAWLNAIVSEMALRPMLFGRFQVAIRPAGATSGGPGGGATGSGGLRLEATAAGEPLDPARHRPAVEVKGATCTALRVCRDAGGGWRAQTVVDV